MSVGIRISIQGHATQLSSFAVITFPAIGSLIAAARRSREAPPSPPPAGRAAPRAGHAPRAPAPPVAARHVTAAARRVAA